MAITRLERKGRKNKSVAKSRVDTIKRLSTIPATNNVDVEAIKAEFAEKLKGGEKKATKAKKTTKKKEEPVVEAAAEATPEAAPVAEAKEEAPAEEAPKAEEAE